MDIKASMAVPRLKYWAGRQFPRVRHLSDNRAMPIMENPSAAAMDMRPGAVKIPGASLKSNWSIPRLKRHAYSSNVAAPMKVVRRARKRANRLTQTARSPDSISQRETPENPKARAVLAFIGLNPSIDLAHVW